jgi:YhcH/YjgK/YiaL family protein
MILDTLENASLYRPISKGLAAAFDYLRHTDLLALPSGRVEIAGPELYAAVHEYHGKGPNEPLIYEAHRKYIDVQYIIRGCERMGITHLKNVAITKPFDEAIDALLGTAEGDIITVPAGSFVVFYPHDLHAPGISGGGDAAIKKIVVKVAVGS